jgi:hypothetical protein
MQEMKETIMQRERIRSKSAALWHSKQRNPNLESMQADAAGTAAATGSPGAPTMCNTSAQDHIRGHLQALLQSDMLFGRMKNESSSLARDTASLAHNPQATIAVGNVNSAHSLSHNRFPPLILWHILVHTHFSQSSPSLA